MKEITAEEIKRLGPDFRNWPTEAAVRLLEYLRRITSGKKDKK